MSVRVDLRGEVNELGHGLPVGLPAVVGAAHAPEDLPGDAPHRQLVQADRLRRYVRRRILKRRDVGARALPGIGQRGRELALRHARRVHAVVGVVGVDVPHIGAQGEAQPHLGVAAVRQFGPVATDLLLQLGPDHHFGRDDAASAGLAA